MQIALNKNRRLFVRELEENFGILNRFGLQCSTVAYPTLSHLSHLIRDFLTSKTVKPNASSLCTIQISFV